tara:strand:+ start:159 stop:506 length:348 start_codon:yes stop_codon:yes gene_type:complete
MNEYTEEPDGSPAPDITKQEKSYELWEITNTIDALLILEKKLVIAETKLHKLDVNNLTYVYLSEASPELKNEGQRKATLKNLECDVDYIKCRERIAMLKAQIRHDERLLRLQIGA